MVQQDRHLIWFIAALLLVTFLPPPTAQAQSFSVYPSEISIAGLFPGGEAEFDVTIHNRDDTSHTFMLSTYNPKEWERRGGRTEFPDDSWVSFSPQEIKVAASSDAKVKVRVTIPSGQKWANKYWEVWLRVAPEEKELLVVNYYVRLLVSTGGEGKSGLNIALIAGISVGAVLLSLGIYYLRQKAKGSKSR